MPFEIKTEGFETVEQAVAYLKDTITTEIRRLEGIETDLTAEKARILANRDEVLGEKKDLQAKLQQVETDLAAAKQQQGDVSDAEKRFAETRSQLEADFNARIQKLEDERTAEKEQAAAANLKAAVMAELGKPEHRLINPEHFWKLHGERLTQDETSGELYVDLGDFKRQTAAQYIEDVAQRPSEQHLFKAKGGRGNDSPGSGDKPQSTTTNPWKKDSFNLTEQGRILSTNPGLAARLKSEAGK